MKAVLHQGFDRLSPNGVGSKPFALSPNGVGGKPFALSPNGVNQTVRPEPVEGLVASRP